MREVTHEPDKGLVLEVAFEGLQRSTRHKSGLAMRFPRISRLRWDKPPREADRLETLEKMLRTSKARGMTAHRNGGDASSAQGNGYCSQSDPATSERREQRIGSGNADR